MKSFINAVSDSGLQSCGLVDEFDRHFCLSRYCSEIAFLATLNINGIPFASWQLWLLLHLALWYNAYVVYMYWAAGNGILSQAIIFDPQAWGQVWNIAFHLRPIWLQTLVEIDSESFQRWFPSICALPSVVAVLLDWNLNRRPFLR